ncbi:DUF4349 domain-containing protein [uncultured Jatrophihabitans sp.]|uniref:DUF4349 domain-containing protein n=1 Tax=uncultured Jatrophihabitans sp. TaxID=1610747 RepID=UPI0035CA6896
MNHRTVALAALAAGSLALVAGCTSGSSGGSSASSFGGDNAGGGAATAAPAAAASAGPARTGDVASSAVAPTSLILTGAVSLSVRSDAAVGAAATRATGIADGSGGRVDADSRTAPTRQGEPASATLVLRVPNAALPAVLTRLASLGTVRSQELQTKDVTAQVADVTSRVTSARAAIAGLNRLYARAETVRDLITVESSLAARQSNLEALEAQQRTLTAQTSLATITLSIDVRARAAAKHHQRSGFVGGLHNGWHAFTSAAHAVATAAGAVLPFAALAVVVAAAGWLVVRRRRVPTPPSTDSVV